MVSQPEPAKEPAVNSSLQLMIMLLIICIVLAILGLNAWSMLASYQRDIRETEENATNLALSLSRQAEDTFLQVDITLRDLAERIENSSDDPASLVPLQEIMKTKNENLPQVLGIFFYGNTGKWLATSSGEANPTGDNSDRAYFRYHQTHDTVEMHIDNVVKSRSTGQFIIPVSRRINNADGSFRGVLLATVAVDYFKQYYGYFSLSQNDVLSLLIADGHVLYGRPYMDRVMGKDMSVSPLFKRYLADSTFGTATFISALDGIERIYGYARLKRYPLVVAAGYDKADRIKQWRNDSIGHAIGSLMLIMIICALGYVIIRQVREGMVTQYELVKVRNQLMQLNSNLEMMAMIDGLTGLSNRRFFDLSLDEHLRQAFMHKRPLALILLDVDYFKNYNDRYGHVAGDICLQNVGDILRHLPGRKNDVVARYGGEEFAIILPDTDIHTALTVAENIVHLVRQRRIPHESSQLPSGVVTISAGVFAAIPTTADEDKRHMIAHADKALYLAKSSGRDCAKISQI
ncbi:diguanylate cyclase (GGDEF)-like protein [Biostraticola tofi]|uniref:diguanylate cyclase n=1 Tax=Biostraticola tofi TaxID=466109 RepID=A0A4R3YNB7_9GAMM|nr:diguanylate cyclase (GGDEF)-like protein [Biostraticola tofi]